MTWKPSVGSARPVEFSFAGTHVSDPYMDFFVLAEEQMFVDTDFFHSLELGHIKFCIQIVTCEVPFDQNRLSFRI